MDVFCAMGTDKLMKGSSRVCTDSQLRHRVSVRNRPSKISSIHVCFSDESELLAQLVSSLLLLPLLPFDDARKRDPFTEPCSLPSVSFLISSESRLTRNIRNSWASCCCVRVYIAAVKYTRAKEGGHEYVNTHPPAWAKVSLTHTYTHAHAIEKCRVNLRLSRRRRLKNLEGVITPMRFLLWETWEKRDAMQTRRFSLSSRSDPLPLAQSPPFFICCNRAALDTAQHPFVPSHKRVTRPCNHGLRVSNHHNTHRFVRTITWNGIDTVHMPKQVHMLSVHEDTRQQSIY